MSGDGDRQRMTLVLAAMTAANAMILVDQTAVPLALPDIMKTFGVGSQEVQWVLNGSLLPLAGLLVFGGRLGDLVGRRRVFVAGAVVFVTASAIGGLAPDFYVLLAARVAQGVGGALMLPTTVAIVNSTFPPDARGRALGTMGGAAAVFGALGPTIGGALTSVFSWRAVLLINVPLALVAVLLALRHVPADEDAAEERERIDAAGTALLSLALVGLVFGLSQSQQVGWASAVVILPLAVSGLAAVGFVLWERMAHSPLVDFSLLRERNYLGASLSQLLAGMAEIGLGVIFPLLLILNLTWTPRGRAGPDSDHRADGDHGFSRRSLVRPVGRAPAAGDRLPAPRPLGGVARPGHRQRRVPLPPARSPGLRRGAVAGPDHKRPGEPRLHRRPRPGSGLRRLGHGRAVRRGPGIAVLYSVFHATYVDQLDERVALSERTGTTLKDTLQAAEATGLKVPSADPALLRYLEIAQDASNQGYVVTFITVAVLATIAGGLVAWLVRKPKSAT